MTLAAAKKAFEYMESVGVTEVTVYGINQVRMTMTVLGTAPNGTEYKLTVDHKTSKTELVLTTKVEL